MLTQTLSSELSRRIPSPIHHTAVAPATCGELVQGVLPENGDFLVNCPIDLFSKVRAKLQPRPGVAVSNSGDYEKLKLSAQRTLDLLGHSNLGVRLTVETQVPRGKGLASSTSEIAACAQAVAAACGARLSASELSKLAVSIESSDGIYFEGVTLYGHLSGQRLMSFGTPPVLHTLIVDCGGEVITEHFDRARFRANALRSESRMRAVLRLLAEGFRGRDARRVAIAATESARMNQEVLFKAPFEDLLRVSKEVGALGVNCAHSGTVLGVLYEPGGTDEFLLRTRVEKLVGKKAILGNYHLIGGGTRVLGAVPDRV